MCTAITAMYAAPATAPIPSWDAYTGLGFRLLANLGVVLLLTAAATTALADRRRDLVS